MKKMNSLCLPYFLEGSVSIYSLDGSEISVAPSEFQDITPERARFHQFYTYLKGGAECEQEDGYAPSG